MSESGRTFSARLIAWQQQNGRHDLPWQKTRDAYRVWLSEIMLQQTQVGTVLPYYVRFLDRFPTVEALAQAPLESVLELWSGLGYYTRARNLHRCAQSIVANYDGKFPRDPQILAGLPGIGRSTAAAISAFAFGVRAAILDGNVKRVLTRCFGVEGFPGSTRTEKVLWALADSQLPDRNIEAYTQGLMDLGSALCTRSKPLCADCPMREICTAYREGRQAELPTAKPRKILPERQTTMVLFTDGEGVFLERRPSVGIWGGLWALPECTEDDVAAYARQHGFHVLGIQELSLLKHTFSHFRLTIRALRCQVVRSADRVAEMGWQWLGYEKVEGAALPTPIRSLIRLLRKMEQHS